MADDAGAAGAQKAFDSLIFQKKVDALISMETSAARNAGLPIVGGASAVHLYVLLRGRSCNKYMYVDAWVPDQQVAPIVDYFAKDKGAKTFFLIGSDYAFGRGMLGVHASTSRRRAARCLVRNTCRWTARTGRRSSQAQGGQADALITSTAGGAPNVTLTKQIRAAGINFLTAISPSTRAQPRAWGPDADGIFIRLPT